MMLFQREAAYSVFSKGMAHFDTHQVGCVEGRAIGRCGRGGHPRLRNHTSHHATPHNKPRGQLTSTPIKWGVWEGELLGVWGEGTHAGLRRRTPQKFLPAQPVRSRGRVGISVDGSQDPERDRERKREREREMREGERYIYTYI